MDGVAVVVGDAVAGRPNLALLLAVSFHKFPEGLALALLLLGAGYSRRTALLWTLGIESTNGTRCAAGRLWPARPVPAAIGPAVRPCRRRLRVSCRHYAGAVHPPAWGALPSRAISSRLCQRRTGVYAHGGLDLGTAALDAVGEHKKMKRLNFTFDDETEELLEQIAGRYYHGQQVADCARGPGVTGDPFGPCGLGRHRLCTRRTGPSGKLSLVRHDLSRRGSPLPSCFRARQCARCPLRAIPQENWLDCSRCVEGRAA